MRLKFGAALSELSPSSPPSSCRQSSGLWCPLVTRARLMAVLGFSLVTTVLLLLQCLSPRSLTPDLLCCSAGSVQAARLPEPPASAFADTSDLVFEEYDDRAEGGDRVHLPHTRRRLPQCIIIGVRKGGTRALLEFLALHPNVRAEKSEMHFFDEDENYTQGLEWYRRKMPWSGADQVTVEKTPAYFVEEGVPERVMHMNSSVKLLLIVRDPIDRTVSDYMQIHSSKLAKGRYHETFEELVIDPSTQQINKNYKPIRRSIYHRHMERWMRFFPLSQFHVVSGENLVKNPVQELSKVEAFLGLDHRLTHDRFYFNHTKGFYCMKLQTRQKCLAPSKGRDHPYIDPGVHQKLRDFFRPLNAKFYDIIGVNMGWQQ